MRLPLLAQSRSISTQGAAFQTWPAPVSPINGLKILVVDDDEDTRSLLEVILQQEGAIVMTAISATEALRQLDQVVPDLLLSDIGMPEIDGYALMQILRSHPAQPIRQLPAVALTAYAGECDQQQAIQAGFQHHLAQPIDPIELGAVTK